MELFVKNMLILQHHFAMFFAVLDLTSSSAMAERPRELGDFKKARVNGGTDNQSLTDSQFPQVSPQPLTDPPFRVV